MNPLEMIAARVGESNIQALSARLGTSREKTLMTMAYSFPVLLKGLAKNASAAPGAQALAGALDRDHDGSILANLGSVVQNPASVKGAGILKHVFGDQKDQVAAGIGAQSGVTPQAAGQTMEVVAPMVMAFLGKKKASEGLDASGIAGFIIGLVSGKSSSASTESSGGGVGGFLGGLKDKIGGLDQMGGLVEKAKGFIDKDKDGDVMDDLQGMLGGLLGGK